MATEAEVPKCNDVILSPDRCRGERIWGDGALATMLVQEALPRFFIALRNDIRGLRSIR